MAIDRSRLDQGENLGAWLQTHSSNRFLRYSGDQRCAHVQEDVRLWASLWPDFYHVPLNNI